VTGAWVERPDGVGVAAVSSGEPCLLCFEMIFRERVEDPVFTLALRNEAGQSVFATSSQWTETSTGAFEAQERVIVRVALDLWLAPGSYHIAARASRSDGGGLLGVSDKAASIEVTGDRPAAGVAALPHDLTLQRL
jgi:methionine-rich copper-binding protein CopC